MFSSCSTSCSVSVTQIPIRKHRFPHSSILCPAWSIQRQSNRCWGTLHAGTRSQSGPARHGMGWRRFSRASYLISWPHLGVLLTPQHSQERATRAASTYTSSVQSQTHPLYIHTCPANTHTYRHGSSGTETRRHITGRQRSCRSQAPLLEAFLIEPRSAPRYPARTAPFSSSGAKGRSLGPAGSRGCENGWLRSHVITAAGFAGKKQSPWLTHLRSPRCCNLKSAAVELETLRQQELSLPLSLCGLVSPHGLAKAKPV